MAAQRRGSVKALVHPPGAGNLFPHKGCCCHLAVSRSVHEPKRPARNAAALMPLSNQLRTAGVVLPARPRHHRPPLRRLHGCPPLKDQACQAEHAAGAAAARPRTRLAMQALGMEWARASVVAMGEPVDHGFAAEAWRAVAHWGVPRCPWYEPFDG
jgi:hypothetical protein